MLMQWQITPEPIHQHVLQNSQKEVVLVQTFSWTTLNDDMQNKGVSLRA